MFGFLFRKSNPLVQAKLDLIDFAFSNHGISSFADLGGIWGVEGGYTFHALKNFPSCTGTLVDLHVTETASRRSADQPRLRLIQGGFGDQAIADQVGVVDAVFLFDVLLHQVNPDWNRILEIYAQKARCMLIYNQQWIGSENTVRLLDLGEDEYFSNVPHDRHQEPYLNLFRKLDDKHPLHDRTWRDVHHIWQWGITDRDLEAAVERLGYRLKLKKNCGRFGRLKNFENHAFLFCKE